MAIPRLACPLQLFPHTRTNNTPSVPKATYPILTISLHSGRPLRLQNTWTSMRAGNCLGLAPAHAPTHHLTLALRRLPSPPSRHTAILIPYPLSGTRERLPAMRPALDRYHLARPILVSHQCLHPQKPVMMTTTTTPGLILAIPLAGRAAGADMCPRQAAAMVRRLRIEDRDNVVRWSEVMSA